MCLVTATFIYTCVHIGCLDIDVPHFPSHPSLFCTFNLKTGKPLAVDNPCPACRLYQSVPLAQTFAAAGQIIPFLRARSGPEDEAADNLVAGNWKGYTALYHILQTGEMQTVQRPVEEGGEFSPLGPGEYEGMFELRPSESWPADVATSPSQLRRWTMTADEDVSQSMIDDVEEMLEGASDATRVQAFAQVPHAMLRRWSLVSAVLERLERPGWRDWSSEDEEEIAQIVAEARIGRESIIETVLLRPLSGEAFGKQKVSASGEGGILTAAVYRIPAAEAAPRRPQSIDVDNTMSTPRRASFVPDTPLESLRIRRGDTFDTLPGTPRRASFVPDTPLTPDRRSSQASEESECRLSEASLHETPDETPPTAPPTIPEIAVEVCPDVAPNDFTPFIRRSIFDVAPKEASRFSKASNSDSIPSTSDSVASVKHVFVDGDRWTRNTMGSFVAVERLGVMNRSPAHSQASSVVSSRRSSIRTVSRTDSPNGAAGWSDTLRSRPLALQSVSETDSQGAPRPSSCFNSTYCGKLGISLRSRSWWQGTEVVLVGEVDWSAPKSWYIGSVTKGQEVRSADVEVK
ncbi:hypothetical protein LTR95_003956 [Oleoguttula sp. CCFEE 5521]